MYLTARLLYIFVRDAYSSAIPDLFHDIFDFVTEVLVAKNNRLDVYLD